jgi:GAF domain-containing protein
LIPPHGCAPYKNASSDTADFDVRKWPSADIPRDAINVRFQGRCALEGKIVHIHDVLADHEWVMQGAQKLEGVRTALGVPLLRDRIVIGTMFLSRPTVNPFSQKQIDLVTTFAAQAVIATENARLLNELRESLEQQTATSKILRVISTTPGELNPVFSTMLPISLRATSLLYA